MLAVILPWSGRVWRQRGPGSRHALVLGGQPCASRANRRSGSRGAQEATACTRRVGTPLLQSQEVDREVACSSDRDSAVRRTQRAAAPWQVRHGAELALVPIVTQSGTKKAVHAKLTEINRFTS